MVQTIWKPNIQNDHFSQAHFIYYEEKILAMELASNISVGPWLYRHLWTRPFQIQNIQKLNFKTLGIGMAFGAASSDFDPPL